MLKFQVEITDMLVFGRNYYCSCRVQCTEIYFLHHFYLISQWLRKTQIMRFHVLTQL